MIGKLFEEYRPQAWHWSLVETINKLLLTGALCFIRPGYPAQSVAGLLMTFVMLQYYQRVLPFSKKPYRQMGYVMQLVLYLFFVTAVLIDAKIMVFPTASDNEKFLSFLCVILYLCVFVVPTYIVVQAIRAGLVEEEEEEEEEEEGSESGSGSESESDSDEEGSGQHHKGMNENSHQAGGSSEEPAEAAHEHAEGPQSPKLVEPQPAASLQKDDPPTNAAEILARD